MMRYVIRAFIRLLDDGEPLYEEINAVGLDTARRVARRMYSGEHAVGIFRIQAGDWQWVENWPPSEATPALRRLR
jgi:hypothetical protein